MESLQPYIFATALGITAWLLYKRVSMIRTTILLGKPEALNDYPNKRLQQMLLFAFGQKKMFDKPVVGVLHFIVYSGFILINIELIEIVLDGLTGHHRILAPLLGAAYPLLITFLEILAAGVLVACVIFLLRRFLLPIKRLQSSQHRELRGWPTVDATIILLTEILLMWAFLSMNSVDIVLQQYLPVNYPPTGQFLVSSLFTPLFSNWEVTSLQFYERIAWWTHILGICAFAVYVTYSKHLHIFLAFPSAYFSRLTPVGKMRNMNEITQEVQLALGLQLDTDPASNLLPERFGAKDIQDLSWKSLLEAYTCTECGRCSEVCPATSTGKALSPRKIMTDTRDRLEEVGKQIISGQEPHEALKEGKTLLNDYITEEELLACTSCQACVDACPVLLNPLHIILELRRYQIMEASQAPTAWNMMFANIETNQAPWKFSPSDRFNWSKPTI